MKESTDALRQILKPYEPLEKALKDSFTDVCGAINGCLEQFGKKDLFTYIQHETHVTGKHVDIRKDEKRNIEDKVKRPQQMVYENDQQNSKLKREIQQHRPINAKAPLQLFHKHEGNTIKEIEEGIKTILVNKLGAIDFTNCQKTSDIDDGKLLIVPCIVTSRVAADAQNAIKDISSPMYLSHPLMTPFRVRG
ncbi:uncharacterized protein LOC123545568 [Mercenaria mercenaria]|uniref:uncharacterized protein LOC123545568 n=1 Tax=Mercenaria mercenaria TaxID=6596 RepID=UPI00234E8A64|nr:uncharacterized protein LOC123545568 [Mercenaria mercenaria]